MQIDEQIERTREVAEKILSLLESGLSEEEMAYSLPALQLACGALAASYVFSYLREDRERELISLMEKLKEVLDFAVKDAFSFLQATMGGGNGETIN